MGEIIGIIGGSGLYNMEELVIEKSEKISTPFGEPSDEIHFGKLKGEDVVFLSRHGKYHRLNPSSINYRANIYALKQSGVTAILSVSAVGSMKEEIKPGELLVVEQFVDLTKGRRSTFFEDIAVHVSMADPTCPELSRILGECVKEVQGENKKGTYLCIEGPQFSTKGESQVYRLWGVDVIGMTNATEAKLAREAEICYTTLALVTDYDCWRESGQSVTVEEILKTMSDNVHKAQKVAGLFVKKVKTLKRNCSCREALKDAIVTAKSAIGKNYREKLSVLLGKYLKD